MSSGHPSGDQPRSVLVRMIPLILGLTIYAIIRATFGTLMPQIYSPVPPETTPGWAHALRIFTALAFGIAAMLISARLLGMRIRR